MKLKTCAVCRGNVRLDDGSDCRFCVERPGAFNKVAEGFMQMLKRQEYVLNR